MKTCSYLVIKVGTEISPLSDRETTIVVVGDDGIIRSHFTLVSYIAILETNPVRLVGTDSPVETRIELAILGTLLLEEVVQPWRCREVCPSTESTWSEVRLYGMTLCSVRTGIDRSPLIIHTL